MKSRKTLRWVAPAAALMYHALGLHAQVPEGVPDLSGMWSDPPARAEDNFCHIGCTVAARDYLTQLLEDPANLDRSYAELRRVAQRFNATEYVPSHLTEEALANYPFDPRSSPSLTQCKPWGFTRQILAPHAMELTQFDDRVTLYYSEWTALRTVYTDGRALPANPMPRLLGYSVGHYEGDTLVVETIGVAADHTNAGFAHSDRLTAVERFTRSADGSRLDVEVTFSDPETLVAPLVMARAWGWAPGEEIYPYEDCVIPGE
ncbi:MAG: hypothetical protein OXJ56_10375 [Rhodospirillaceae bacterium]|nr:hypothetical protein [Rhodospirillaceae bacterium]MDE0363929.1 hypothetical protein [Rhodospirillaceae bacterium]